MVNYKQNTGKGIDLTETFSLRHSGTFCHLIKIPCAKPQAVPLTLSQRACYRGGH